MMKERAGMKYQRLGKSDLKVSQIVFGCWTMGHYCWNGFNEWEWIKTI